jgi:hypothetical protein
MPHLKKKTCKVGITETNFACFFYACDTLSVMLRKDYGFFLSENGMVRGKFVPERERERERGRQK